MKGWATDVRYVLRSALRDPGTTIASILALVVGLAGASAIFTIVEQVVIDPLPYRDPERLVTIWSVTERSGERHRSAFGNVEEWRSHTSSFEAIGIADPTTFTIRSDRGAERIPGAFVSPEVFSILGISPISGRNLSSEDASRREPVAVVSQNYAVRRFGSADQAINETIRIDGSIRTVIGVMPAELRFPSYDVQIWEAHTLESDWSEMKDRKGLDSWLVLGRLGPGALIEAAQDELSRASRLLREQYPQENAGLGARIVPLDLFVTGRDARTIFWTLFAGVVVLLLISCANLAKVLLVRGQRRRVETSVRLSLGASPGRIARIPLIEAVLLSTVAFALAGPGSILLVRFVANHFPAAFSIAIDARPNGALLQFGLAIVFLTAFLSSSVAVLMIYRSGSEAIRTSPRSVSARTGGLSRAIVVLEVAMAFLLVWAASTFFQNVVSLRREPIGFDAQKRHLVEISLPREMDDDRRVAAYESITSRMAAMPGVDGVGAIEDLFTGSGMNLGFERDDGARGRFSEVTIEAVTPGFFEVTGNALLRGRSPSADDRTDGEDVAVINRRFAEAVWPAADSVGRRFRLFDPNEGPDDREWITVIGVSADARREAVWKPAIPQVFRPHSQRASRNMNVIVRSEMPTGEIVRRARELVASLHPDAVVHGESTLIRRLDRSIEKERLQSFLATAFSGLGLVIAAIGIFGVAYQSVVGRSREIAIRLAVGATPARVMVPIIVDRVREIVLGVILGTGAVFLASKFVSRSLHEVPATDPLNIIVAVAIILVTALVATWAPASWAASLDPSERLRAE